MIITNRSFLSCHCGNPTLDAGDKALDCHACVPKHTAYRGFGSALRRAGTSYALATTSGQIATPLTLKTPSATGMPTVQGFRLAMTS
jgi:hypothetical protein